MKRHLILSALLICALLVNGQKFSGQVYILAEHFIKDKCEVDAPCDCCAAELIFLSKRRFSLVDRCLYHDIFLKGRYSVTNKLLTLRFKPKVVNNNYDEKKQQEYVEKKKMKMPPLVLQINTCGSGKVVLGHSTIREYKYGSRQTQKKDTEIIKELKKSTAWKSF